MGNLVGVDIAQAAKVINGILAPSVMISACGLLLLGLQNKYSSLINRIRMLNEEKFLLLERDVLTRQQRLRLASVRGQIANLLSRSRLDRNAILSLYGAIIAFVLSSILIGANFILNVRTVGLSIQAFMTGTTLVLIGATFAFREIRLAYHTVLLEVRSVPEEMDRRHDEELPME